MGEYDRSIATAKRLIAKKGQKVVWKQVRDGIAPDPLKPWQVGPATAVSVDATIAFLPVDKDTFETLSFRAGTELPKCSWLGYMAQSPFAPNLKDVVVRDGVELRIAYIDKLAPNGQNVLYTILFL